MGQHFRLRKTQHAFDGRQRQRVVLVPGSHDQRMTDRESKGQPDREYGALARLGLHVERATETLDLGGYNVHTDAAARLLGNRARGGKAGLEDELHRVLIAEDLSRSG